MRLVLHPTFVKQPAGIEAVESPVQHLFGEHFLSVFSLCSSSFLKRYSSHLDASGLFFKAEGGVRLWESCRLKFFLKHLNHTVSGNRPTLSDYRLFQLLLVLSTSHFLTLFLSSLSSRFLLSSVSLKRTQTHTFLYSFSVWISNPMFTAWFFVEEGGLIVMTGTSRAGGQPDGPADKQTSS